MNTQLLTLNQWNQFYEEISEGIQERFLQIYLNILSSQVV